MAKASIGQFIETAWQPSRKAFEKERKIEQKLEHYNRPIGTMTKGEVLRFEAELEWEQHKVIYFTILVTAVLVTLANWFVVVKANWG